MASTVADRSMDGLLRRAVRDARRRGASRRSLLKGGLGVGAAALAGGRFGLGPSRVGAQDGPRFDDVTLRVFTQTGPLIAGPIRVHADRFRELTAA